MGQYDFKITSGADVSQKFADINVYTFNEACNYLKELPYGRNSDRNDPTLVLKEKYGTCSTKHALLKQLAIENKKEEVKLVLGMFKMNGKNTPVVKPVLERNNLDHLPEAHTYLKIHGEITDFTKNSFASLRFVPDLIFEMEIEPVQTGDAKIVLHKNFLADWLKENPDIKLSLEELFKIREECIQALSGS